MPTIQGIDSFAHRTISGDGLYDNTPPTGSVDTGTVRGSDPASYLVDASSESVLHTPASLVAKFWQAFAFNVHTRPTDAFGNGIAKINANSGVSVQLDIRSSGAGYTLAAHVGSTVATASAVLSLDTWYWIEMIGTFDTTTHYCYWRINGANQVTGSEGGTTNGTAGQVQIGDIALATAPEYRYSCHVWGEPSSTSDWLGEQVARSYALTGVGTHNLDASTSTFYFKNVGAGDVALTTAETTSYQAIDDWAISTDYILVKTYTPSSHYLDPDGDITNQWTKSTGTASWSLLDEAVRQPSAPTTGSDRITTSTTGQVTEVALETFTKSGTISQVKGWWHGANAHATRSSVALALYKGASQIATTTVTSTTETWYSVTYTGDLTQAEMDDLRIRLTYTETQSTANTAIANEVYAEVIYAEQQPSNAYYAEWTFADSAETLSPTAVRAIAAVRQSVAGGSSLVARVVDSGSNQDIFSGDPNSTSTLYKTATMTSKPSGGTWTNAALNGLTGRFGLTADANPEVRLDAMLLEAVFPAAAFLPQIQFLMDGA